MVTSLCGKLYANLGDSAIGENAQSLPPRLQPGKASPGCNRSCQTLSCAKMPGQRDNASMAQECSARAAFNIPSKG
jgi:hypothetical protein